MVFKRTTGNLIRQTRHYKISTDNKPPHQKRANSVLEEEAILSSKTIKGVVRFRLPTDKAREDIGLEGTSVTTGSIDLTNVDLDRGVILGSDNTVSGRANPKKTEKGGWIRTVEGHQRIRYHLRATNTISNFSRDPGSTQFMDLSCQSQKEGG